MQMARAWKIVLKSALLLTLTTGSAYTELTTVYHEDFESWLTNIGIASQDPWEWVDWGWTTTHAPVASTLDANSNATQALDVKGQDINLFLPARLFDGVTASTPSGDDTTHMQISMDVWVQLDNVFNFLMSSYTNPPDAFNYYNKPGSGFEISGVDGYDPGVNGFYGAAGPQGNNLTLFSYGTYLYGFDYFHRDFDPGADAGEWHHVMIDMTLDPTSIDANGDMTVYTEWWLDRTNLFTNGYPNADYSYTGAALFNSGTNQVWPGMYSTINSNDVWGLFGGVQSVEICGYGSDHIYVDNILINQGYGVGLEQKLLDTCGNRETNAWLSLIPGSSWGASGITWTYTNSGGLSTGLSNVNYSSTNYFYFNPSNSTPGTYVVTASVVGMMNYQSVATVNVFRVQLMPTNAIVCWQTTSSTFSLTNSYWGTNGILWTGTNGLGIASVINDSLTFTLSNSVPTNYIIIATIAGFTNCHDKATLNVFKVNLDIRTATNEYRTANTPTGFNATYWYAEAGRGTNEGWRVLGFVPGIWLTLPAYGHLECKGTITPSSIDPNAIQYQWRQNVLTNVIWQGNAADGSDATSSATGFETDNPFSSAQDAYPNLNSGGTELCIFMRDDPGGIGTDETKLLYRGRMNCETWVQWAPSGTTNWVDCTAKTNWYIRFAMSRPDTNSSWQVDTNTPAGDNEIKGGSTPTGWGL